MFYVCMCVYTVYIVSAHAPGRHRALLLLKFHAVVITASPFSETVVFPTKRALRYMRLMREKTRFCFKCVLVFFVYVLGAGCGFGIIYGKSCQTYVWEFLFVRSKHGVVFCSHTEYWIHAKKNIRENIVFVCEVFWGPFWGPAARQFPTSHLAQG